MLANVGIMDYSCLVGIEGTTMTSKEAKSLARSTTGSFFHKKAAA